MGPLKPFTAKMRYSDIHKKSIYTFLQKMAQQDPFAGGPMLFDLTPQQQEAEVSEPGKWQARAAIAGNLLHRFGIPTATAVGAHYISSKTLLKLLKPGFTKGIVTIGVPALAGYTTYRGLGY